MKGRYSFSNIRRLLNILLSPASKETPEVVVSLDAEKAFDRVEWGFLFEVLKRFSLGSKFVSWIALLYSSPKASIIDLLTRFGTFSGYKLNFSKSEFFPVNDLALQIPDRLITFKMSRSSDVRVPIKILRDTGAFDSYIVDSVLLLSGESDTGDTVLSWGMGLKVFPIPVHKVYIDCDLVKGEVAVGVRPGLPIEGIHFILGNGLAGGRIWTDVPPAPLVTGGLIESGFEESSTVVPGVTSSCVITRAMAKTMLFRNQKAKHCSTGQSGRGGGGFGGGGGGFDGGRGGGGVDDGRGGGVDGDRGGSCSRGRGRGKEMFCYRCGDQGHMARDCDQTEDVCYNCNKPGHMARDCGHANDRRCYFCGGLGHIWRRCNQVKCYRCGDIGHVAGRCSKASEANGYNCRKADHLLTVCPEENAHNLYL
ncbi:uncharacterized protein LOC117469516 [Trematomus bernacchii]|uniref:uncharacterized protein LOC117469516 n=1 Tax=Trematomus bernacchii TaxID=40690 RepID=UPI00146D77C0|nr:uncharacterized protein LOC117469516 [Trematomus bernacchii]